MNTVYFKQGYPHCTEHGAMNKVSKHGMWRCLMCHIGYDETTKEFFKDSTEGFRRKKPVIKKKKKKCEEPIPIEYLIPLF